MSSTMMHIGMPIFGPNTQSTWNAVCDYQRYCSYLAHSSMQPPTTRVSEDCNTFTYNESSISIPNLRHRLRKLLDSIKDDMAALLPKPSMMFTEFPEEIVDNWADEEVGYSFMSAGEELAPNYDLLASMIDAPNQRMFHNAPGSAPHQSPAAIKESHDKLNNLGLRIGFLVTLLPSQFSRGGQYPDVRIRNGTRGRGIFLSL